MTVFTATKMWRITTHHGDTYPKLRFRVGRVERQPKTGPYKFRVKDIPQGNASHYMTFLSRGPPPFEGAQGSHRCKNCTQLCINPSHLVWESSVVNQSRDSCDSGSASQCPHPLKCTFTDVRGRWLPHRNALGNPPCDCEENCYDAVTNASALALREGRDLLPSVRGTALAAKHGRRKELKAIKKLAKCAGPPLAKEEELSPSGEEELSLAEGGEL